MAETQRLAFSSSAENRSKGAFWLWDGEGQLSLGLRKPPPYVPSECRAWQACAEGSRLLHRYSPISLDSAYQGFFVPGFLVGFHGYFNETEVARVTSRNTSDMVFEALRHKPTPAPWAEKPVETDDRTFILPLGTVRHIVVPQERLVLNITDGHVLTPGVVARFVFQRGNSVFIGTFGEGMGAGPVLNGLFAPSAWSAADAEIAKRLRQ